MREIIETGFVPDFVRDALDKVRERFPDAVVAGGALHDPFVLGSNYIRDIDVFAPAFDGDNLTILQTWPAFSEVLTQVGEHGADYIGTFSGEIHSVHVMQSPREFGHPNFWDPTPPPVNLVLLRSPDASMESIIGRFDFGLCQIGFDGRRVYMTDAFWKDYENSTFTYLRQGDAEQEKRSRRRASKLHPRYPRYRFIFPSN